MSAEVSDHGLVYILDGVMPVQVDEETWAAWLQDNDRVLWQTDCYPGRHIVVQTVFRSVPLDGSLPDVPVLFSTSVGDQDGRLIDEERYPLVHTRDWAEAEAAHRTTVARLYNVAGRRRP